MIAQIKQLQNDWRTTLPRFSEREWLKVFPEAKGRIQELIRGFSKQAEDLSLEIYEDLVAIYKLKSDDFSTWFTEEIIKIWKGEKLERIIKILKRLKFSLTKEVKSEISDLMIQQARSYPFEALLPDVKRDMAICPFHKERNASFYIKNNYGYCFGCGWKGNPIDFVMEKEGLSFKEAVKLLQ